MDDKLPEEDRSWPQSVENRADAAHRALQHQDTLLGVALLGNSRKCNSFSAKRVIGSSNLAGRQPEEALLTLAPIDSFFWKLQAEQLAELHERLRSAEEERHQQLQPRKEGQCTRHILPTPRRKSHSMPRWD